MEIAKQIKRCRTDKKLSQEELAEQLDVSRQTVSNWETGKNYPDVKSLLLLSALFDVTLDILVKGDLEEMKKKVNDEETAQFDRDSAMFAILLVGMILLPIPLVHFLGLLGGVIWVAVAAAGIYYAIRVEKQKKNFDIQTYREILAFSEGTTLTAAEKNQELGKRPYQKILLAAGAGLLAILVSAIMIALLR